MKNSKDATNYELQKREAKELYRKIGRVWCPILNDYIHFTRPGFDHLIWHGQRPRRRREQMQRFALLPYAAAIINNAEKISEYRENQTMQSHSKIKNVKFWCLAGGANENHARIIIRQVGNGNKKFLSTFPKKKTKSGP